MSPANHDPRWLRDPRWGLWPRGRKDPTFYYFSGVLIGLTAMFIAGIVMLVQGHPDAPAALIFGSVGSAVFYLLR